MCDKGQDEREQQEKNAFEMHYFLGIEVNEGVAFFRKLADAKRPA